MKKSIIYSGQRFKKEIIDHLQLSKEEATQERFIDYISSGIVPLTPPAIYFNFVAGSSNTYLAPRLTILPGVAYNANGERIEIPEQAAITSDTDDGYNDITNPSTYTADNPSHVTDNGLSVNVSTPRSTGATNIPLTVGIINKIWIGYLAIIDDGGTGNDAYTLRKTSLEKQFYKQLDGYRVVISATNPDVNNYVYLGQVDLTEGNLRVEISNISLEGRVYARYINASINQGAGSLLDADTVDAKHASEFELLSNKNQSAGYAGLAEGKINLFQIPQGVGSTLNADMVDGKHVKDINVDPSLITTLVAGDMITLDVNGKWPLEVIPATAPLPASQWPAPFRFYLLEPMESTDYAVQAMAEMTNSKITGLYATIRGSVDAGGSLKIVAYYNGSSIADVTFTPGSGTALSSTGLATVLQLGGIVRIGVVTTGTLTSVSDVTILLTTGL